MKRMSLLGLVFVVSLIGMKPKTAWWSILYPQTVYEAGVLEEQEKELSGEAQKKVQIKWKLAEWIADWF